MVSFKCTIIMCMYTCTVCAVFNNNIKAANCGEIGTNSNQKTLNVQIFIYVRTCTCICTCTVHNAVHVQKVKFTKIN